MLVRIISSYAPNNAATHTHYIVTISHSQVVPVVAPPRTVDGIELVVGERVRHVVVVAPVEHPLGLIPKFQSSGMGERAMSERGEGVGGGDVFALSGDVWEEQEELGHEGPEEVGRCGHQPDLVHHHPPVDVSHPLRGGTRTSGVHSASIGT